MKKESLFIAIVLCALVILSGCPAASAPPPDSTTDAQAVSVAKTTLTVGFSLGDSAEKVRSNITLATTIGSGVSVEWVSNDAAVISNSGVVNRPAKSSSEVVLTAALRKGSQNDIKTFTLIAYGVSQEKVDTAKESLLIVPFTLSTETAIILPQTLLGTTIGWESNPAGIIGTPTNGTATVTTPASTTAVTLTATITADSLTATKTFTLKVYARGDNPSADELIAAAKNILVIQYATGDSESSVKKNITLPVFGAYGVVVSWSVEPDKTTWCSNAGIIKRDLADIPVKLTATLSKNGGTDATKTFVINISRVQKIVSSGTTYAFDVYPSNLLTIENEAQDVLQTGGKYVYTVDPATKKLSVEQTDKYDKKTEEWYTKLQRSQKIKTSLTSIFEPYKLITEKPSVTHADVIAFFKTEAESAYGKLLTNDEIITYIVTDYSGFGSTIDEFNKLAEDKLSTATKAVCSTQLSGACSFYKITANSWTVFMSKIDEIVQKNIGEDFITSTFTYELVFNSDGTIVNIITNALYDAKKAWYLQYGDYQDTNTQLSVKVVGDGHFSHPGRTDGKTVIMFNDEFRSFTDSNKIVWNVSSDTSAKTITVTSGSTSYSLSFMGKSL